MNNEQKPQRLRVFDRAMCNHSYYYELGRKDIREGNSTKIVVEFTFTNCNQCGLTRQSAYNLGRADEQAATQALKSV